jgi:NADP-dependent 3-hydroxy acid dehydrogenase YdfG
VLLTSRKAQDLEESAAHLEKSAIEAISGMPPTSASRARSCASPQDADFARLGNVDILVNNAGATLGRRCRGPSARGVGQGDEPQRALDLPDEPRRVASTA